MSMPIIMLFVVMAICFIIRMPVSFSMLAASITYFMPAPPIFHKALPVLLL